MPTYYPKTGYGEIADQIAKRAQDCGVRIHLNTRALAIDLGDNSRPNVHVDQNGIKQTLEGHHVVSTLPLPNLISMMGAAAPEEIHRSAATLSYRPLIMLGLMTNKQNILKSDYIYMLDRPYNRIAEMNQFSPQTSPSGKNLLAIEIPCGSTQHPLWKASQEELFEKCLPALKQDGILQKSDVEGLMLVKSAYAYPIYKKDYKAHLSKTLEFLDHRPQISTLGRSGEFMYMDADKCIRRAFNLADQIASNRIKKEKAPREVSV